MSSQDKTPDILRQGPDSKKNLAPQHRRWLPKVLEYMFLADSMATPQGPPKRHTTSATSNSEKCKLQFGLLDRLTLAPRDVLGATRTLSPLSTPSPRERDCRSGFARPLTSSGLATAAAEFTGKISSTLLPRTRTAAQFTGLYRQRAAGDRFGQHQLPDPLP
ncbi:hypothetical protein PF008_g16364 [Phytophthora fragariae]|uniref:Uncharacterized protein n=1 Tax=Phytophthora fragariae TaxID=53985 RepID=A0A6G0RBF7_9STRA|nr:hypothetical protein PF008_g16364 [Phytophthora fragariae]